MLNPQKTYLVHDGNFEELTAQINEYLENGSRYNSGCLKKVAPGHVVYDLTLDGLEYTFVFRTNSPVLGIDANNRLIHLFFNRIKHPQPRAVFTYFCFDFAKFNKIDAVVDSVTASGLGRIETRGDQFVVNTSTSKEILVVSNIDQAQSISNAIRDSFLAGIEFHSEFTD